MNAFISDRNFSLLIQGKIDLDKYVVTESLSTISRWNLLGRLYHGSKLDSTRICANIEAIFQSKLPVLTDKERERARENLKIMLVKFRKTKVQSKEKNCREILERVIDSLKPQEQEEPSGLIPLPAVEIHYQLKRHPHWVDRFGPLTVDAVMQMHTPPSDPISKECAQRLLFLCEYRKDKMTNFNVGLLKQINHYFNRPNKVLELVFDIPSSEVGNLKEQLKEGKAEFTHAQMRNLFQVISHPERVLRNFDEAHEKILPFLKTDTKYQNEKALQIKLLSFRNRTVYEQKKEKEPVRTAPVAETIVSKPTPVTVSAKKGSLVTLFQNSLNRFIAS